jgi:dipeptidyl aminopeptidase/acylaminoacyl peptidase
LQSTEDNAGPYFTLLAFDPIEGGQIAKLWEGATNSLLAVEFSPVTGDCRLLASTNQSGVRRPLIWNPLTNERIDIPLAELQGDTLPLGWSPDGTNILLCQFTNARQQLYRYDLNAQKLVRLEHPAGAFGGYGNPGYFADNDEIFVHWQDATHPQQLIALDAQTGAKKRIVLAAGDATGGAAWQSFTFKSSDGQEIQGWLALPAAREEGPFPTIFHTHGGPTAVQPEAFSPESQAWLDHGFAFVTINYRGSTTFGREFQDKINGDLGHWEVEDMVAGRKWLVENRIADPDKILLTGRSYGGYLTLMGLGKTPELWAGGMAGVAIADWAIQYEDTAPSLRGYQVALLGGTPQENPQQYAASSPITYAENVRVPVQIIQGRNDTRTPARPIEMYEAKLKALGKPIELHWFEAGHTGSGYETAIEHQALMLSFAYRVLGYS